MPLTRDEIRLRSRIPRRNAILLYDAALSLEWTTVAEIAELAGLTGLRRAQLELAELVRDGWLDRFQDGPRVRYVARPAIVGDRDRGRSPAIVGDRDRGRSRAIGGDRPPPYVARARGPDPSGKVDLPCTVRPSGGGSGEGADGRTDGKKFAPAPPNLVGSIAAEWSALPQPVPSSVVEHSLARFWAALQALERPVTEHELGRYLRAALLDREGRRKHPAFADIGPIGTFFGRACIVERFERWRAAPDHVLTSEQSRRYRELEDEPAPSAEDRRQRAAAADAALADLKQRDGASSVREIAIYARAGSGS